MLTTKEKMDILRENLGRGGVTPEGFYRFMYNDFDLLGDKVDMIIEILSFRLIKPKTLSAYVNYFVDWLTLTPERAKRVAVMLKKYLTHEEIERLVKLREEFMVSKKKEEAEKLKERLNSRNKAGDKEEEKRQ